MARSPARRLSRTLKEQRRRWTAVRFALLATTLLVSLGILMVGAPLAHDRLLLQLALYAPLLIGIYVISTATHLVALWAAATAFSIAAGFLASARNDVSLLIADVGFRCVLFAALMTWIAREMLREDRVSLDTILGGICIYLLIGFIYSLLYTMLLLAGPDSLQAAGGTLDISLQSPHPLKALSALFYFSFTAFTTMGFGDIVPVSGLARFVTITEGMIGQLYPAIFIARLVSLSLVQPPGP